MVIERIYGRIVKDEKVPVWINNLQRCEALERVSMNTYKVKTTRINRDYSSVYFTEEVINIPCENFIFERGAAEIAIGKDAPQIGEMMLYIYSPMYFREKLFNPLGTHRESLMNKKKRVNIIAWVALGTGYSILMDSDGVTYIYKSTGAHVTTLDFAFVVGREIKKINVGLVPKYEELVLLPFVYSLGDKPGFKGYKELRRNGFRTKEVLRFEWIGKLSDGFSLYLYIARADFPSNKLVYLFVRRP